MKGGSNMATIKSEQLQRLYKQKTKANSWALAFCFIGTIVAAICIVMGANLGFLHLKTLAIGAVATMLLGSFVSEGIEADRLEKEYATLKKEIGPK